MLRQLQCRADDLAEGVLVFALEMRRCRTLHQRLEAFRNFGSVIDRIDALRRDAELVHCEKMLVPLDKKVAEIMRSPAYRISEWFRRYEGVRWYVGQATIDPVRPVTQC